MRRLVFIASWVVAVTAQAAQPVWTAPIAASSPEGLQRLHLALPVLQASRSATLSDLRVVNAKDESLPMAFVPPREGTATRDVPLPLFAWPARAGSEEARTALHVRIGSDGALVQIDSAPARRDASRLWLVDASAHAEGERLDSLALRWERQPQGLAVQVSVEGSDDLERWQPVGGAALVEVASGPVPVLQDRVPLAAASRVPRYLRLRSDGPLPLQAVQARWEHADAPALDEASLAFTRDETVASQWVLDLGAPLALRSVQPLLPQANTVVVAWLDAKQDASSAWQPVGRYTLYRLTREGRELQGPPLALQAPPARWWRWRLDPSSPPLAAAQLPAKLQWPQRWIVFAGRAPAPLSLELGREGAKATALPLASLLPGYREGDEARLPVSEAGALVPKAIEEPGVVQRLREAGPAEHRRWVLWAVLVVGVAGLGWLARGLTRELKSGPPA